MKRLVHCLVATAALGGLAAGGGGGTEAAPGGLAPGWRFEVERSASLKRFIGQNQDFKSGWILVANYTAEVTKVESGRPTELACELVAARQGDVHPVTGAFLCEAVGRKGDTYRVELAGGRGTVINARTGRAATATWESLMAGSLMNALVSSGPLEKGRQWTFQGREFDDRMKDTLFRKGVLTLRVDSVEKDAATGLDVAKMSGQVKSKCLVEDMELDCEATVQIQQFLQLPVPASVMVGGTLSGSGVTFLLGRLVRFPVSGSILYTQTIKPTAETVQAALRGGAVATTPPPPPPPPPVARSLYRVEEERVGQVAGADFSFWSMHASKDGTRYAAKGEKDKEAFLLVDGVKGPEFDGIRDVVFSPDGRRLVYIVKQRGTPTPIGRPAAAGAKPDQWALLETGAAVWYDDVSNLTFSPDGRRFAYSVKKDKKAWVIIDGAAQAPYDSVGNLRFSPDGKRFAFGGTTAGKTWSVVEGRQPVLSEDEYVIFLPGENREAREVRKGDKHCILLDGVEHRAFTQTRDYQWTPDGRHFAYIARDGSNEYYAVVDGRADGPYDWVDYLMFVPGRDAATYFTKKGQTRTWVIGPEVKSFPQAGAPTNLSFSADGRRYAYALETSTSALDSRYHLVIDGQVQGEYRSVSFATFSPDGTRVACEVGPLGTREQKVVLVDGKPGTAYKTISHVTFSPDSQHVAYAGNTGNDERMVVDGQEGPLFKDVTPPVFVRGADGRATVIQYFGARGDSVFRVRHVPEVGASTPPTVRETPPPPARTETPPPPPPDAAARYRVETQVVAEVPGATIEHAAVTPDGRHTLVLFKKGQDSWHVVADGRTSAEYDIAWTGSVKMSPDGRYVVCIVRRKDKKESYLINGQEAPYDGVWALTFRPKDSEPAYFAKKAGAWYVVVAGEERGPSEAYGLIAFAPNADRPVYSVKKPQGWFMMVDGREEGPYEEVRAAAFSADGRHRVCEAKKDGKRHYVVDGQPGPPFDEVQDSTFGPGALWAYQARRGQKWLVVGNGREHPEYDRLDSRILFSADGRRTAYVAGAPGA